MGPPVITLTTDFGLDSPYVAALKGVILGINPHASIVDLGHQIPPQDLRAAAWFLECALPYFPPGPIHVVIVDPGVGSERALLYWEIDGHRILAPDNGCCASLADQASRPPTVIRLADPSYWRSPPSATFHGRDILAPVAAHLSRGLDPHRLGPVVSNWVRLPRPQPQQLPDGLLGEVVFVDHFGNLITNLPGTNLAVARVYLNEEEIPQHVRTYADAAPGTPVALVCSTGQVEIAVVQGHAARQLHAGVGSKVRLVTGPTNRTGAAPS